MNMSETKEKNEVILFTESNGRLIIAEVDKYGDESVTVLNPHVVQTYQGEDKEGNQTTSIGYVPYAFIELLAEENNIWDFSYSVINIAVTKPTEMALNTYLNVVERGRYIARKMKEETEKQKEKSVSDDKVIKLVD